MEDPTVFYPQLFRALQEDQLLASTLEAEFDSLYTFSFQVLIARDLLPGDTLLHLAGEGLAGADTVSAVLFSGLLVNGQPLEVVEVSIRTETTGPILPYVRFGQLDPGRPNPTVPGQRVTWGFRIDADSEVIFTIYDVTGRTMIRENLGVLKKGVYTHSITPDLSTPSGFFVVHLETKLGHDYEAMHVLH